MEISKICRYCGNLTSQDELVRRKDRHDGYDNCCKECNRQHSNQHRIANIETVREKEKQRAREYRHQYPDREREKTKRYRRKHPETVRNTKRRWIVKNRAHYNAIQRANNMHRYAIKKAAEGRYTDVDVQKQFRAQHGKCYWCDQKLDPDNYHVDHVIPLSRGGSNGPDNIVIAHPRCNQSKSDKLPHEWEGNGGKLL